MIIVKFNYFVNLSSSTFTSTIARSPLTPAIQIKRVTTYASLFRFVVCFLFFFLRISNSCNYHLAGEDGKGRRYIDILLSTSPVCLKKLMLLRELPDAVLCLQVVEVGLIDILDAINFVNT